MSPENDFTLIYTDKYFTLRDTISPRLRGLMGKTLRKLTPLDVHLNIKYLVWYDYINLAIHYNDAAFGNDFDLGFFKDSLNQDYFMLLSRYYNTGSVMFPLTFNSTCFGNYNNILLYNLIDSTKQTIQNNGMIYASLTLGDALFYRVTPVVRSGGSLIANETITNETLLDDMTIENGAALTVNGTYNAKANITLKADGKINAGTNGKIIFDAGKKLIIEGNAQVNGVVLEFNPATTEGVLVKQSGNLTMYNSSPQADTR